MMNLLAVAVGGALGSVMRYLFVGMVNSRTIAPSSIPLGTFSVNVSGSCLIGLVIIVIQHRFEEDTWIRPLLVVGLLGGFTTFSAFSLETIQLIQSGFMTKAIMNMLGNVLVCLVATGLGVLCCHGLNQLYS